ncbi:MAG: hypothetical protein AB1898_33540 [Acidobacteriota bacterium]
MVKTRFISFFVLLPFLSIAATGQSNGVVVVSSKAPSGYDIQVANKSSVPVTAFIVRCHIRRPAGNHSNLYRLEDAYYNVKDTPIRTNEFRQFTLGPRAHSEGTTVDISLLAAVYEDGTGEGDPMWLSRIASNRERVRNDLPVAIAMLKQALLEGTDSVELTSRFEDFRLRNLAAVQSTGEDKLFERAAAEEIPTQVIENLKDFPGDQEPKKALELRIGALINTFSAWYAKIPH